MNMRCNQYTCSVVKLKIKIFAHSFLSSKNGWLVACIQCMFHSIRLLASLLYSHLALQQMKNLPEKKINNVEYFRKIFRSFLYLLTLSLSLLLSVFFFSTFCLFLHLIFNVNLQLFIVKVKPSIKFIDWDFGALSLILWQNSRRMGARAHTHWPNFLVNYQNENFKLNFVHLLPNHNSLYLFYIFMA